MKTTTGTASGNGSMTSSAERAAVGLLLSGAITALTLGSAFGLLALGVESFWVIFPLGFGVVLPTTLGYVGLRRANTPSDENGQAESESDTAIEKLRQQYARGELSDAEFEQRLELLMENTDEMDR